MTLALNGASVCLTEQADGGVRALKHPVFEVFRVCSLGFTRCFSCCFMDFPCFFFMFFSWIFGCPLGFSAGILAS